MFSKEFFSSVRLGIAAGAIGTVLLDKGVTGAFVVLDGGATGGGLGAVLLVSGFGLLGFIVLLEVFGVLESD